MARGIAREVGQGPRISLGEGGANRQFDRGSPGAARGVFHIRLTGRFRNR